LEFSRFNPNGNVYAVHPAGHRVDGVSCYPSIKDIPGPVDYAFGVLPARFTLEFMEECAVKGVKAVGFFTAGFSESGEPGGEELQAELVSIARRGGVRIIGPNCAGLYCPSAGVSYCADFAHRSGSLGLICQSGGNATYLVRALNTRGVYISKAVSYGNACDLNETELLHYFANDPETSVIAAYIEGVRGGRDFVSALTEAARAKPTIVLKGGSTKEGASTAASHTGSLAGSAAAWRAIVEQAGAIQVDDLDEIVDLAALFTNSQPINGNRVAVIGLGGGASVLGADECIKAGLALPPLTEDAKERLRSFSTEAGNIYGNPLDTQSFSVGTTEFAETVKTVAALETVDFVLLQVAYDETPAAPGLENRLMMFRVMLDIWTAVAPELGKPTGVVFHYATLPRTVQTLCEDRERCVAAGLPVFHSMAGAARAIGRFYGHTQRTRPGGHSEARVAPRGHKGRVAS